MEINWLVIVIVGLLILGLLTFIIISNRRDRKKLEDKLNSDHRKQKEDHNKEEDPDDLQGT
jgi:flagellar biosynthesis/type III secretory pathway M-ring protein FliF/YscJ